MLVIEDVRGFQQVGVDRDAPFVVKGGLGDRGAVDLRFQKGADQGRLSLAAVGADSVEECREDTDRVSIIPINNEYGYLLVITMG